MNVQELLLPSISFQIIKYVIVRLLYEVSFIKNRVIFKTGIANKLTYTRIPGFRHGQKG